MLRLNIAMPLDGFAAGLDQSVENPLGIGGMRLYHRAFPLAAWRKPLGLEPIGAIDAPGVTHLMYRVLM